MTPAVFHELALRNYTNMASQVVCNTWQFD